MIPMNSENRPGTVSKPIPIQKMQKAIGIKTDTECSIKTDTEKCFLEIADVAEKLYRLSLFTKVPAWINLQGKRNRNPQAVLYVLKGCLSLKPKEPWGWCETVIRNQDAKFNAREFESRAQEDKNGFNKLVDALKQFMGGIK